MKRSRASALLATLVATVTMALGSAFAGAQPAAAALRPYPPPPPKITCNKGVVKYGVTVRVRGYQFLEGERVIITVRLKPRGSDTFRTVRQFATGTSRSGNFTTAVRMARPGTVTIEASGSRSHGSASVSVFVIDKHKGGNGGWTLRTVGFTGAPAAQPMVNAAAPARQPDGSTGGLGLAGLAVLGLAGSVLITRRIVRRRRAG